MTVYQARVIAFTVLLFGAGLHTSSPALASESTSVVERQSTATDVFDKNSPAIVTILTPSGFGSGVLVDPSGVIVTNLHVVAGKASAKVTLANGDIYDDVQVVAVDARRDIIVLKISGFQLPTVEFGDSWQRPLPLVVAGLALLAVGGVAVWGLTRPAPERVARFPLPLSDGQTFSRKAKMDALQRRIGDAGSCFQFRPCEVTLWWHRLTAKDRLIEVRQCSPITGYEVGMNIPCLFDHSAS